MNKKVTFVPNGLRKIDPEARTAEFVISDATKDRHNTIIPIDGWVLDNYEKNGIVGYMHDVYGGGFLTDPNPDSVIGKGEAFIEKDKLIGRVTFEPADINPLADKIFKKVQFGTLKATSVGFNPLEEGTRVLDETTGEKIYHYGKRELLEWSIVNIPSNPSAVARAYEIVDDANGVVEDGRTTDDRTTDDRTTDDRTTDDNSMRSISVLRKRLKLKHRQKIKSNQNDNKD